MLDKELWSVRDEWTAILQTSNFCSNTIQKFDKFNESTLQAFAELGVNCKYKKIEFKII